MQYESIKMCSLFFSSSNQKKNEIRFSKLIEPLRVEHNKQKYVSPCKMQKNFLTLG